MYRIDSLHPDRLVCEACAMAIGAVTLDPGSVPLGALPSADAAAEWPELVATVGMLAQRSCFAALAVLIFARMTNF
jgi:hypothetical protein